MYGLFIPIILLVVVGLIFVSIIRNHSKSRATLTKTMSFNPETDIAVSQSSPTYVGHESCVLATTLRIIGVVNVVASFIIALVCSSEYGSIIAFIAILSGCLGCLFCYALAKCVDAADHYLKNH